MSIAPGQTRPRGEDIATKLEAHAPFAAWKAAGVFAAVFNSSRNLKASGLDAKLTALLDQKVKRLSGVLITVTPFSGANIDGKAGKVANNTAYEVTYWERIEHRSAASPLAHPLDIMDELQRVLADMEFAYADERRRPRMEKMKVGNWEEAPDPVYLTYQISCESLVPLGVKGS